MATATKISFEDTSTAFSSRTNSELQKSNFLFSMMGYPSLVSMGTYFIQQSMKMRLPVKSIIKKTLFSHFCGGESIEDSQLTIEKLGKYGIGTILDFAAEGISNEASFDRTVTEISRTIEAAATNANIPFSVFKPSGVGSIELLEKIQLGQKLTKEERDAYDRIKKRFDTICQKAASLKVRLMIDAEESWLQDTIDSLVYKMMEKYNKEQPLIFNTYQLYNINKLHDLRNAVAVAREKGYYFGAKLVRGAYMEKERERAHEKGYPDPIQPDKEAADNDYDLALTCCVENRDIVAVMAGTHNENSSMHLVNLMEQNDLPPNDERFYFAQLFGMSDHISYNLSKQGYKVAKYVPYGPVELVLPYLFRRAEENTSIAGQMGRELQLIRKELNRRKTVR